MHILFLSDNFPPEGNAPATRTYEHAKEWVKLGHKVTIITGAPNFPEGKVFPGYRNGWYLKEYMDGIEVRRVKTYISANEGFLKRIADFLSFMFMSFFAGLFVSRPDVIVGTSPQFFTVCGAWALSVVRRRPFVFELRDIWPASITAVGAMKHSGVIKFLERLEMFLYRRADRIVSVTNAFKDELIRRGVSENKIGVVLNGVDLSVYGPASGKDKELAKSYGLENKFVIGYVGTHGLAHALDKVLDAAEILKGHDEICFLFAGGGAVKEDLDNDIRRRGLTSVVSVQRQPKSMMSRLWSLCDVSLISLRDTPLFSTVIPSKIFESMGCGLPMIVSAPAGEATDIVGRAGAGIVIDPEDPVALATAVICLYENDGLRASMAQSSYEHAGEFDRASLARALIKELDLVV